MAKHCRALGEWREELARHNELTTKALKVISAVHVAALANRARIRGTDVAIKARKRCAPANPF